MNQTEKTIKELIKLCSSEKQPIFIAVGYKDKRTYHTVTPEELKLEADTQYNEFLRVVTGFNRSDYE